MTEGQMKFSVGDLVQINATVTWAGGGKVTVRIDEGDGDYTHVQMSSAEVELISPGPPVPGDIVCTNEPDDEKYLVLAVDEDAAVAWVKKRTSGAYKSYPFSRLVVIERAGGKP